MTDKNEPRVMTAGQIVSACTAINQIRDAKSNALDAGVHEAASLLRQAEKMLSNMPCVHDGGQGFPVFPVMPTDRSAP